MYAPSLDSNLAQKLRAACGFEHIVRPVKGPADMLVLDVNITAMGRGGSGMIRNNATATVDTLVVLTDGQSRELLGTSRIHGESSGMIVNNARPETEAIDVVAKAVVETLAKSGCTGPRVARVEPPPQQGSNAVLTSNEGSGGTAPPPPGIDESKRPDAEKLNDQGKDQLQNADMQGALVSFQQAVALIPDARYEFNICLTFEAQEQWANAVSACKQARTMNPEPRLVEKIDHRLDLISHRK
jgi:hypothetical protein